MCITLFHLASKYIRGDYDSSGYYAVSHGGISFLEILLFSSCIGYGTGLLSALVFRHWLQPQDRIAAASFFLTNAYAPFLLAESLGQSGIVAILVCGLANRRYTTKVMDKSLRKLVAFLLQLLSHIAETFVFLGIGLRMFHPSLSHLTIISSDSISFAWWVLCTSYLARAIGVYSVLGFINYSRIGAPIDERTKHCVYFAGSKGAVAACLSMMLPETDNKELWNATTTIVIFVTLIQAGLTEQFLSILGGATKISVLNDTSTSDDRKKEGNMNDSIFQPVGRSTGLVARNLAFAKSYERVILRSICATPTTPSSTIEHEHQTQQYNQ